MKSLLALSPIMLSPSELEDFSHCLDFLKKEYQITMLDSLEHFENVSYEAYSTYWKQKIAKLVDRYDAFVGFSFGGLLLLNVLEQFANKNKSIIFICVPVMVDHILREKLNTVLSLCDENKTQEAINQLYSYVFQEAHQDYTSYNSASLDLASMRIKFGLSYLLNYKFEAYKLQNATSVLQLVGEHSKLVTKENILTTLNFASRIVPKAGQRILEDNPIFTQAVIKAWLHDKH